MRPNLFANTPDILHEYLQHGGRPAFEVRLVLAATLGASYGIYSGFELFENVPVKRRQRGIPGFGEVPDPPAQLRSAGQPRRTDPHDQHAPARSPGAAARHGLAFPPDRQPRAALLQQAFGRRHRPLLVDRQPRSLPHAARLRAAAARRLGLHAGRHDRGRTICCRASGTTGAARATTCGSTRGHASRTSCTCSCRGRCLTCRPCRIRPDPIDADAFTTHEGPAQLCPDVN